MKYTSEWYGNEKTGAYAWVEERYSEDLRRHVYVVVLGEIKEGREQLQDIYRNGGTLPPEKIQTVVIETRPFSSGEPAFRCALEYVGKDPILAQIEYDKFLSIPRKMQAFDPSYRPRNESEKEQ